MRPDTGYEQIQVMLQLASLKLPYSTDQWNMAYLEQTPAEQVSCYISFIGIKHCYKKDIIGQTQMSFVLSLVHVSLSSSCKYTVYWLLKIQI